jgi:triacylglycerol esterase/lipase EstA (alpha/beta hydrolase family)
MADNGRMWLRDFLPKNAPFNHSRIITFGYTSTLVDKRKLSERFEDYADQLIKRIILLRGSTTERRRPIIFVCHSMGGLVARLAMTRMSTMSKSDKFQGLCLSECGLLFLSTPHSGSIQAEQSQFLLALGEGLFGLRKGVVNELKLFNPSSADSIDIFKNMEVKPVIKCFCEGEPTRAMGKYFRVSELPLSKAYN